MQAMQLVDECPLTNETWDTGVGHGHRRPAAPLQPGSVIDPPVHQEGQRSASRAHPRT